MTKHLKRNAAPKNWPISRKGTKFVIKNNSKGIPILILLRDILHLAQNRSEVKKAIHRKDLLINNKFAVDEKNSLELFDVLTLVPSKENYKLILSEKGKYDLLKIEEKENKTKIAKIIGKKILKGKKIQLNLNDGRNYISELECKVNDSVIVNFENKRISKILPLKENSEIFIIGGKHAGTNGKILKIIPEHKMVEIESDKGKFNALIKQIMIIK